jgi:RNA polymerase sigma-70 factor (ECF subfamily)
MTAPAATPTRQHATLDSLVHDEVAFRDWYDRVLPRVYRYLLSRCDGDVSVAEDLTWQTMVHAIRDRHRFDGRTHVVTWLCSIGRIHLVDHYRHEGRGTPRFARLVDEVPRGVSPAWKAGEARLAVESALATLELDQRLALVFRYLDGLAVRDVAAALGRSESSTESLLARARDAFRRAYRDSTDG